MAGAIRRDLGADPVSEAERWGRLYKFAAVASAGFFGAPGLPWDLPVTTGVIMRSVADIARSFPGESLDRDGTKRSRIEVFAFGGPEPKTTTWRPATG